MHQRGTGRLLGRVLSGMADLAARMSASHDIPVVDGVAAAVKLAEALVGLGLRTSKTGAYAAPPAKAYLGVFAGAQPVRK